MYTFRIYINFRCLSSTNLFLAKNYILLTENIAITYIVQNAFKDKIYSSEFPFGDIWQRYPRKHNESSIFAAFSYIRIFYISTLSMCGFSRHVVETHCQSAIYPDVPSPPIYRLSAVRRKKESPRGPLPLSLSC